MPKEYEAIRDRLIGEGLPVSQAKKRAAMIYNAAAKKKGLKPVTRSSK